MQKKSLFGDLRCKHFNGTQHQTCKAGIAYADVKTIDKTAVGRPPLHLPCLGECDTCPSREYSTPEEIAAQEAEAMKYISAVMIAMPAVKRAVGRQRGAAGNMTCPVCKTGTLAYFVARNRHTSGACSTPDCVQWIE